MQGESPSGQGEKFPKVAMCPIPLFNYLEAATVWSFLVYTYSPRYELLVSISRYLKLPHPGRNTFSNILESPLEMSVMLFWLSPVSSCFLFGPRGSR